MFDLDISCAGYFEEEKEIIRAAALRRGCFLFVNLKSGKILYVVKFDLNKQQEVDHGI